MFYDLDKNATPVEYGAMIYQKNCTSCHGLERQGNPPTYPALTKLKKTDEQIATTLRQGLGIMPAFAHLSEKDVSAIIAFLKSDGVRAQERNTRAARTRYSVEIPFFVDLYGAPAISPPWGTLNAIDLRTGSILWKVPLGEYPALVEKRHP